MTLGCHAGDAWSAAAVARRWMWIEVWLPWPSALLVAAGHKADEEVVRRPAQVFRHGGSPRASDGMESRHVWEQAAEAEDGLRGKAESWAFCPASNELDATPKLRQHDIRD